MKCIYSIFVLISFFISISVEGALVYKDYQLLEAYALKLNNKQNKICFVDYDKDFDSDLIVGDIEGKLSIYENLPQENIPVLKFVGEIKDVDSNQPIELAGGYASVYPIDYDTDRDYDLVCGNKQGNIILYENKNDLMHLSYSGTITKTPSIISSLSIDGHVYSIDIKDNLMAVAADKYVYLYDISWHLSPILKATIKVRGKDKDEIGIAYDVKIKSNYLYIAAGKLGLLIWDISNLDKIPEKPEGYLDLEKVTLPEQFSAKEIAFSIKGDYAYLATAKAGLWIIDVSNPKILPEITDENKNKYFWFWQPENIPREFSAYGLRVINDYVYLASNYYGLAIIDVRDPTKPQEIANNSPIRPPERGCARSVFFNPAKGHGYIYVACGEGGVQIIDIGLLREVALINTEGFANDVYLDENNKLYVAVVENGVRGYDITSTQTLKHIYNFNTKQAKKLFCIKDDLLYVADGNFGIKIIDINEVGKAIDVGYNSAVYLVDVTADGYLDLFVGNADGYIFFYKNIAKERIEVEEKPWQRYMQFSIGYPVMVATFTVWGVYGTICDIGRYATLDLYDLNKDGILDIICGDERGGVVFYEGIGFSTITAPGLVEVNIQHYYAVKEKQPLKLLQKDINIGKYSSISFADIDLDSEDELLVATEEGFLYYFDNYKDLTFYDFFALIGQPRKIKPKDKDAYHRMYIHTTDFNNDGRLDLLIGDKYGHIDLWLNYGNLVSGQPFVFSQGFRLTVGTYNQAQEIDVGENATIFVCDWNNDGKKDILAGNSLGEVLLYLNQEEDNKPIFKKPEKLKLYNGEEIKVGYDAVVYLVDWENDKDLDLLVGDRYGYIWLFINTGDDYKKVFSEGRRLTFDNKREIKKDNNATIYVGDFNKDYKKDLILGGQEGYVWVLINQGQDSLPIFKEEEVLKLQTASDLDVGGLSVVNFIDLNGDRKEDLIISNDYGEIYFYPGIYLNTPPSVSVVTPKGKQNGLVTIKYTIRDNEFDSCSLKVEYSIDSGLTFIDASSAVGFGEGKIGLLSAPDGIEHAFVWDSIKDIGYTEEDVVLRISVYDGKEWSKKVFTESFSVNNIEIDYVKKIKAKYGDIDVGEASKPVVVDWNNDNKKDLLVGNKEGFVALFLNIGEDNDPKFEYFYNIENIKTEGGAFPFVCDYNNDGKKDLLVGNGIGEVYYYENTGEDSAPLFSKKPQKLTLANTTIIDVGDRSIPYVIDWDNDYKKDLLIGNSQGYVYLYKNTGEDTSPIFQNYEMIKDINNNPIRVPKNASIFVIDYNKNQKKDLLIGAQDGLVYLFINIGEDHAPIFDTPSIIKIKNENFCVGEDATPWIFDWNNDGIYDIISGNKEGNIWLYQPKEEIVNTPPKIIITDIITATFTTTITGTVSIGFRLYDEDGDSCRLSVFYSLDNINWFSANIIEDISNLLASPGGRYHTISWRSDKDLPDYLGGVYFKIIPYDRVKEGFSDTISFYIDNLNRLPSVSSIKLSELRVSKVIVGVILNFDLVDMDNDLCRLKIEYTDGSVWKLANIATLIGGTITNPGFIDIKPAEDIKLVWLASVDEVNKKNKYKVRITPSDDGGRTYNVGGSAVSQEFYLDNTYITSKIIKSPLVYSSNNKSGYNREVLFEKTKIKLIEEIDFDVLITIYEKEREREIVIKKADDLSPRDLRIEVGIVYEDVIDEIEKNYKIFIQSNGRWHKLDTKYHDFINNTIWAEIYTNFSILSIRSQSDDVGEIKAYPVPYKAGRDIKGNLVDGIKFMNVPSGTLIKIYDLLGRCIKTKLCNEGEWTWKVDNDYGKEVGSGIYFYVAKKDRKVKTGELVIIK